jgi:hypothetical protein
MTATLSLVYECPATSTLPDIATVCVSGVPFLPRLCDAIEEAVRFGPHQHCMSYTDHAVSHNDVGSLKLLLTCMMLCLRTTGSVPQASGLVLV